MRPRFTDVLVQDFANCNTRRRLFTAFNCDGLFKRFSLFFKRASVSETRPNTALRRGCGDPVRGHLAVSADGRMMAYSSQWNRNGF